MIGQLHPQRATPLLALAHPRSAHYPRLFHPIIIAAEGGATEVACFMHPLTSSVTPLTSSGAPPSPPQSHPLTSSGAPVGGGDRGRRRGALARARPGQAGRDEVACAYRVVDEGHSPREEAIKVPVEALADPTLTLTPP